MKFELEKVNFSEIEKNFASELARFYTEACNPNDGCCSGGGTEVAGNGTED